MSKLITGLIDFLIGFIQFFIKFLTTIAQLLIKKPLLFLLVSAIIALIFYFLGGATRKAKRNAVQAVQQHRQNRAVNKQEQEDNRFYMQQINEILGLIDQRMGSDPNPQELQIIRNFYWQAYEDLRQSRPLSVSLDEAWREYDINYHDNSSQLAQKMRTLNNYLGYGY